MGFLDKLLRGKKSISSILVSTQNDIFGIYGVAQPTDAQRMKASAYLCISGIAVLTALGVRHEIDKLVKEAGELTSPLSMRVEELANNADQLERILAQFPKELQLTKATRLNGLAAFEALYNAMGEELVNDIMSHNKGPMGAAGYAAIVVADGIFGEGKSKQHFMEVSMRLLNFTKELGEAI